MGIPDHLTCLLRNLHAGQEATIRTTHETTDWFKIGKGICQGYILSPCLFNLHAKYQARSEEHTSELQMFKLDLEKAEEQEIKLPTPTGS